MVGFCFSGDASSHQKVYVFFKGKGCSYADAVEWRTFEKSAPLPSHFEKDLDRVEAAVQLEQFMGEFYSGGNDIDEGWFTLEAAQKKCMADAYMAGFTYEGDASGGGSVYVFFKSGQCGTSRAAGWTRFAKKNYVEPTAPRRCPSNMASEVATTERSSASEGKCASGYAHRVVANLGHGLEIPIGCFECVPQPALNTCKSLVENMLRQTPQHVKQRMVERGVHVGIIGHKQVTSDIPAHNWLKGKSCGDSRTFDGGTRGVGGTPSCPCSSCAEENLLMYTSDGYASESIMVHEFSHTVMDCGFDRGLLDKVQQAYNWCKARPAQFDGSQYWMCNTHEFWAELTQAWFHASIRTDVNNGINTRRRLIEAIPLAAELMREAYGDNDWLYIHDCPNPGKWQK